MEKNGLKKVDPNISKEELVELIKQGRIYIEESDEDIVRRMVQEILDKDNLGKNEITDILLDDGGGCIHITFTDAVGAKALIEIGEAFGDDDPSMYAENKESLKIVVLNTKYNFNE